MHELPVIESILNIVMKHAELNQVQKIVSITLEVGELSDLEAEWMQHYFNFLSNDTLAEGAELRITYTPIVLQCSQCRHSFAVKKSKSEHWPVPLVAARISSTWFQARSIS